MKKRIIALLAVVCIFFTACASTDSADTTAGNGATQATNETQQPEEEKNDSKTTYYIGTPYKSDGLKLSGDFESLDTAKAETDKVVQLGRVLYDNEKNIVYNPAGSLTAARILYQAKKVADYMRDNGYTYDHAKKNPAMTWQDPDCEKVASCDRFVAWALYDVGYTKRQPTAHGVCLDQLDDFVKARRFTKITDKTALLPGDIVFVGDNDGTESNTHVFIHAGYATRSNCYRYDAGSADRIRCDGSYASYFKSGQPFCQPLELSASATFKFAYRAPSDDIEFPNGYAE